VNPNSILFKGWCASWFGPYPAGTDPWNGGDPHAVRAAYEAFPGSVAACGYWAHAEAYWVCAALLATASAVLLAAAAVVQEEADPMAYVGLGLASAFAALVWPIGIAFTAGLAVYMLGSLARKPVAIWKDARRLNKQRALEAERRLERDVEDVKQLIGAEPVQAPKARKGGGRIMN
jgi:hypothetical protein